MPWILSPKEIFSASPVVPVMVIKQIEDAVPMAQASNRLPVRSPFMRIVI